MRATDLEIEGAKVERRLARALERALPKVSASVSIYELLLAIQSKDVKKVMRLFPREKIEDSLKPCAKIVEDAVVRGGKVVAKQINRRKRARKA